MSTKCWYQYNWTIVVESEKKQNNCSNKNHALSKSFNIIAKKNVKRFPVWKSENLITNCILWCFVFSAIIKITFCKSKKSLTRKELKGEISTSGPVILHKLFFNITTLKMLYHPPYSINENALTFFWPSKVMKCTEKSILLITCL